METIFPKEYKHLFIIGFRKSPSEPTKTERTGTVILKRTYTIESITGKLTLAKQQLPIFNGDYPDNVINHWQPEDEVILEEELKVFGKANGRVVQTIQFDQPLGGREFTLSFTVRTDDESAQIKQVQLEADNQSICQISSDNEDSEKKLSKTAKCFSKCQKWNSELSAKEMQVVLRAATNPEHTVWYSNVQVFERLRYEHDLAPFKPKSDIIVLEFRDLLSCSESADNLDVSLWVDKKLWFKRTLNLTDNSQKLVFGWEPRVNNKKLRCLDEAGKFSEKPEDYPLPSGFNNCFYNGYSRMAAQNAIKTREKKVAREEKDVPPYISGSEKIYITREGYGCYCLTLPNETIIAAYYYYNGIGTDTKQQWQKVQFTMEIDTLVIEPEINRCYIVWRGVWPFDDHPEETYRRLEITALPEDVK
jgi:hypothetical protein